MYFCSKCSYSYDIVKSSQSSEIVDTRKKIDKLVDALKLFEAGENMLSYYAIFNRDDTNKNKRYHKLSDTDKVKFNQIFEDTISSGAEFKCNNCNNIEPIKETKLLYNFNTEDNNVKTKSLEENEFICKDPILPRTHDYSCKNPNCITHKKKDNKEAIFYKENDSFKVKYICCICYYSW
jgi:hypothetical protein